MKQWTQEELDELSECVKAWVSSPEGQRQIRESAEQAQRVIDELLKEQRIDPARLREPMTI